MEGRREEWVKEDEEGWRRVVGKERKEEKGMRKEG